MAAYKNNTNLAEDLNADIQSPGDDENLVQALMEMPPAGDDENLDEALMKYIQPVGDENLSGDLADIQPGDDGSPPGETADIQPGDKVNLNEDLMKDLESLDIRQNEYDPSALIQGYQDEETREKARLKARLIVSTLSLVIGVALMLVKFYVFGLTHSSAVLADTIVSAMNAMAGIFTLVNILLGARHPDKLSPLRQEKINHFSAGFRGTFIIFAALCILMMGLSQALYPQNLSRIYEGILILLGAGIIKFFLGIKLMRVGNRTQTQILSEHGREMLKDVYISVGIGGGLLIAYLTREYGFDGIISCAVGIHILTKGGNLVLLPFKGIKDDVSEPDFLNVLARLINEYRKDIWIDIHRLRAWHSNKLINIKFHLILPRDFTLERAESETKGLRGIFKEQFGEKAANAFIHIEPCLETDCPFCSRHLCPLRERQGPKREHPWNLRTLTADGGPSARLHEKEWAVPSKFISRAMIAAANSNDLLEWLFEILSEKGLNHEAILTGLEATEPEFRKHALAEELLRQQSSDLRKMLVRMLIYQLPVPGAAMTAVCNHIPNLDEHKERGTGLGLIEITRDASEKVYRVTPLLTRFLEKEFSEVKEKLSGPGARILYQCWWKEATESPSELQSLEIFRLAMDCQAHDIALEISGYLTELWNDRGEFEKSLHLYEKTLPIAENDYRLLRSLALVEKRMGNIDNALGYYQRSLDNFPEKDERGRASVLHQMAEIYTKQYNIREALVAFQQALEIRDRVKAEQDKADTLVCMAEIYANQGKTEKALKYLRHSAGIREKAGDMSGKADILHQTAEIYVREGDTNKAMSLYAQSLEIREKIGEFREMESDISPMVNIYTDRGQINKALSLYQKLLDIKTKLNDEKGKAAIISKMSRLSVTLLKQFKSPDVEKVKKFMAKT